MEQVESFSCIREFDKVSIIAERAYDKIKIETDRSSKKYDAYIDNPKGGLILINSDQYWKYLRDNPPTTDASKLLRQWSENFAFKYEVEINWLTNNYTYFDYLQAKMESHYQYIKENFKDIILYYLIRENDLKHGQKLDGAIEILHSMYQPHLKPQHIKYLIELDFVNNFYKIESMLKGYYPKYKQLLTDKKEEALSIDQIEEIRKFGNSQIMVGQRIDYLKLKEITSSEIELIYNKLIQNNIMETTLDNFTKILREQPNSNYDKILWTDIIKNAAVTKVTLIYFVERIAFGKSIDLKSALINNFIVKYFNTKFKGIEQIIEKRELNKTRSSSKDNMSTNKINLINILNAIIK